jgi:superfamily II DNA or RNA helicase
MATSAQEHPVSFGYHPVVDELDAVLGRARFTRALVADEAITDLVEHVISCRALWDADIDLPTGIYWFAGIEEPLLFQVGTGLPSGPATSVAVDDLAEEHPLASAFGWAEHFWAQAQPVPAPVFRSQDPAITVPGGVDVLVRGRRFVGGHWNYSVFHEGRTQTLLANKLIPVADDRDPVAWVRGEATSVARFGATLTRGKLRGRFADTLYSFRATRTTFRPYQFKPVLKLLQTGKARLLIADEVGLGKTIEAGLIWTELEARREADRVLVVCPSSLLTKWKDEMEERFGFMLTELDTRGLDDFLERFVTGRLPKRQAYICSLERLRTWEGLATFETAPPEFDLVIVDEAHSMRNSDTKSYRLGIQLSEWADSLVFLTATPINLRQEDLLHLLELLAPEDYGDLDDLALRLEPNAVLHEVGRLVNSPQSERDQRLGSLARLADSSYGQALRHRPDHRLLADVLGRDPFTPADVVEARRLLADLNSLSTVITRTKKAEVDDRKAVREPQDCEVRWSPLESAFYAEYLEWCRARANASGRPMYFVMQMPLRLASACLPMAARAVLTAMEFDPDEASDDETPAAPQIPPHQQLLEAAEALNGVEDSKFARVQPTLTSLVSSGRRVLLFTFSKPTLRYLASRLAADMRVAVMHGGISRDDRRRIMADFRAGAYDIVLANRVASEGLDFEFCSAVVNYDLPWNPMEIEQRIGRIDRIGQQEEKILVINCHNPETIDERILMRVLDRIEIFESSIGALEPIIAAQMPALQAAFDFRLDQEQRELKVQQVLTAIESQRAGLREVSDASSSLLVSNDVDVSGLEDELVRTGRYVGQRELGLLLEDWAQTDQAVGTVFSDDGSVLTVRGNLAMADRVEALARQGQRSRAEVERLASSLRAELPIHFVLDQERSRTQGGTLLTATSPLVMAAVDVPGHRQARFANVRVTDGQRTAPEGLYVVVLGQALSQDRGRDEIWGTAVDFTGRRAPAEVTDLLLAGLARGVLSEGRPEHLRHDLSRAASRARDLLDRKHQEEQQRRDEESTALREARRVVVSEQFERRLQTIERRRQTAVERNRQGSALRLFDAQRRRATERHLALIADLERQAPPEIRLEPLAVCLLEVSHDA